MKLRSSFIFWPYKTEREYWRSRGILAAVFAPVFLGIFVDDVAKGRPGWATLGGLSASLVIVLILLFQKIKQVR
jgi:hypothetical protein